MRKTVFGKYIYDSDDAERVYSPPYDPEDWSFDELMQTPEGRLFKFGGGGMYSEYLTPCSFLEGVEFILAGPDSDGVKVEAIRKIVANISRSRKDTGRS